MNILWAVSSVGKGHIIRDIAIVNQIQKMADIEVDWLAPDPAGKYLKDRNFNVLKSSKELAGSGKIYNKVFNCCLNEFNLFNYIREDTKLHQHDFEISKQAWNTKKYDIIVGDEAFWLLSGFGGNVTKKPAPFIFLTDFIGIKIMRPRLKDIVFNWYYNFMFSMSFMVPDKLIYIGDAEEIPNERLGLFLPRRRLWAQKHCAFVKPIVSFNPSDYVNKQYIKRRLGLPEEKQIFLAILGLEGDTQLRLEKIEKTFELLKLTFPDGYFIIVTPYNGKIVWIKYYDYLENLYEYFAVSDLVITESGYGKISELSALGVPFIAIPLDYHFEQEYFMRHRLKHYSLGELLTQRNHSSNDIAEVAKNMIGQKLNNIQVDNGEEVGKIIIDSIKMNLSSNI